MGASMNRRDVLRATVMSFVAAGSVGSLASSALGQPGRDPSPGPAGPTGRGGRRLPPPKIGLQLYTVRNAVAEDFDGTMDAVADIGYREVELAGFYGLSADQLRDALDSRRLRAVSTHLQLDQLRGDWQGALEDAKTLGNRFAGIAYIPPNDDLDFWRGVAREFNVAAEAARDMGLQFFYHNHDWEFEAIDGIRPYDILLDETDPDLVQFELDLYWAVTGGADPVAYFNREPRRFPLYHVKDRNPVDGTWADVGEGDIDFARIFQANSNAGVKHFFVEHDNPPDPIASIQDSYDYLRDELRY